MCSTPETTITPDVFDRISQEVESSRPELLRFVHRPGVVGVREHFQGPPIHRPGESGTITGRALVLVMNHVDGLDLRDWRAERTLTSPGERREVMRTLEQLADVLDWLHSGKATPSGRTVVHGDLSPGNVMVDEHGQATLVDFGLSKLTADHQTAEVWFTPGYAAPEVFDGKRTPGTDRYAFGAIAYFLLSGQSPPATPEQLAHALTALPQIAVLDADQQARITSIYAADPGKRPVNLAGWMKDVRHAVVPTTTSTSQRAVQDTPPRPAAPPVVPPQPAAPPVAAAAAPPAYTPTAQPVEAAPPVYTPTAQPVRATPPETAPVPAPVPGTGARRVRADVQPEPGIRPAHTARRAREEAADRPGAGLGGRGAGAGRPRGGRRTAPEGQGPGNRKQASGPDGPAAAASSRQPSAPTPTATPTPTSSATGDALVEPTATASKPANGTAPGINAADLTVMNPVNGLGDFAVGAAKINTKQYGAAFIANLGCNGDAIAEFDLNREWKYLDFTAGVDDGSSKEEGRVTISLDGQPAAFSELVALGKPITKRVEVTGALRLRLKVDAGCEMGTVVIAAPQLTR